jgi:hypothetical protein
MGILETQAAAELLLSPWPGVHEKSNNDMASLEA